VGVPLGLGLAALAVRVLQLFFTLPPPLLAVPGVTLVVFVTGMAAAPAVAVGVALISVMRVTVAAPREP
jgi:putative ABC transport system permease protein